LRDLRIRDQVFTSFHIINLFYYESIKRELQIKPISECRCDERLKPKVETCVNEKRGDGEGIDSYAPSDTLGYINLTG
jgi:hypothetical protein